MSKPHQVLSWLALATILVDQPVPAADRAVLVTGPGETGRAAEVGLQDRIVGESLLEALEERLSATVMVVFDPFTEANRPAEENMASAVSRTAIAEVAQRLLRRVTEEEFRLIYRYETVNAIAGDITAEGLLKLLQDPSVLRIDLDLVGSGQLAQAVPLVGLNSLHSLGFTGAGVTVAVLDTGYDRDHPDLSDDLVAERCFCADEMTGLPCCPNGTANQSGPGSAEDDNGHGTWVSGVITSRGLVAPRGGAPDAKIVAVKVVGANNRFRFIDLAAGLDWIVTTQLGVVDVVNLSVGSDTLYSGICDNQAGVVTIRSLINNLHSGGVVVFASSGNNASGNDMSAPACVGNAIAVGATYDANVGPRSWPACTDATTGTDQVACFSNSNAQTDLLAPGAMMTTSSIGGGSAAVGGTSFASPLAAACAAALLQADPTLTPDDIRAIVKESSTLVTDGKNGLSFPRLDCVAALGCVSRLAGPPGPTAVSPVGSLPIGSPSTPFRWNSSLGGADPAKVQLEYVVVTKSLWPPNVAFEWPPISAFDAGCPTGGVCSFGAAATCTGGGFGTWDVSGSWLACGGDRRTGAFTKGVAWGCDNQLRVTKVGNGSGTVTSSPAGINCGNDCAEVYSYEATVVLDAVPDIDSTFGGWVSGADDEFQCGFAGTTGVEPGKAFFDLDCRVNFLLKPHHLLTVTKPGSGSGTVTSNPPGIDCGGDCEESFYEGATVSLEATPSYGSEFAGFGGDADCVDGVLDIDVNKACTATFEPCSIQSIISLPSQMVTVSQTFEACNELVAGTGGFTIGAGVDVVLLAGNLVRFDNGFAVADAAELRVVIGPPGSAAL